MLRTIFRFSYSSRFILRLESESQGWCSYNLSTLCWFLVSSFLYETKKALQKYKKALLDFVEYLNILIMQIISLSLFWFSDVCAFFCFPITADYINREIIIFVAFATHKRLLRFKMEIFSCISKFREKHFLICNRCVLKTRHKLKFFSIKKIWRILKNKTHRPRDLIPFQTWRKEIVKWSTMITQQQRK